MDQGFEERQRQAKEETKKQASNVADPLFFGKLQHVFVQAQLAQGYHARIKRMLVKLGVPLDQIGRDIELIAADADIPKEDVPSLTTAEFESRIRRSAWAQKYQIECSRYARPSDWKKVFGKSWKSVKTDIEKGHLKAQSKDSKNWRFWIDNVPPEHRDKYQS